MSALDPTGVFAAQTQAASQFNPLAQALMSSKGDSLANSLLKAQMFQKPLTPPTAPALKFDTNATGIGTGITQGLGNAFNNALQMRQYKQQQERINNYETQQRDLMGQFDLAMAQKQQQADLAAQAQAKQEEIALAALTPEGRAAYSLLDDVGRRQFLMDRAAPDLGKFRGQGKGAEAQSAQPGETQALINKQTQLLQTLEGAGVDINTPQGQNIFRALMSFEPSTQADVDLKKAQASKAGTEAQAAPILTAQDIEQNTQDIQATRLGNVLKNIAIQFEPDRIKASIQGQQLTNKEKADKIQRVDTAMNIFNAFQERLARGEVTPQDVAQVQSQIGMLNGIDPSLDTTLKRMLGLKQEDSLTADKLKKFFQVQPAPPKAAPANLVRDLGSANNKLIAKANQAGAKKQAAQGKAQQVDKRIRQNQGLQSGYSKLEKDAKSQMKKVDELLKKYSNIGPL